MIIHVPTDVKIIILFDLYQFKYNLIYYWNNSNTERMANESCYTFRTCKNKSADEIKEGGKNDHGDLEVADIFLFHPFPFTHC